MLSQESAIFAAIMILSPVAFGLMFQAHQALAQSPVEIAIAGTDHCSAKGEAIKHSIDGGLAVSGANIYAAWNCLSHVLFTASHDGGKTFANTTLISAPNTSPKTLSENLTLSASGNNVAIMWDSNQTGISNPEIRTSSDGGNTFGNIITLNSTIGGINK